MISIRLKNIISKCLSRALSFAILLMFFLAMGVALPAFAEEATSTILTSSDATTTHTSTETTFTATAETTAMSSTSEPQFVVSSPSPEPSPEPEPVSSPVPAPEPSPMPPPASVPSPEPLSPQSQPALQPVVPFESTSGKAFDAATAPSKVKLKILDPNGNVPTIPVFITFVGVGGRTYGGPIDREGALETVIPSGRYYTDFLVIDTKLGSPDNPPSFFLEANEERDFGAFLLTDKSSFGDAPLEQEFGATLAGGKPAGFARIFSLIVKLLLAILKEIRGLRSEILSR